MAANGAGYQMPPQCPLVIFRHPSALSSSDSRFLEKKETWFCTAQIANPARARIRKRMMMMIAMVMLRLTMMAGGDRVGSWRDRGNVDDPKSLSVMRESKKKKVRSK